MLSIKQSYFASIITSYVHALSASCKSVFALRSEIRKILDNNNCDYEQRERFLLLCTYQDVSGVAGGAGVAAAAVGGGSSGGSEANIIQWEMEVCFISYFVALLPTTWNWRSWRWQSAFSHRYHQSISRELSSLVIVAITSYYWPSLGFSFQCYIVSTEIKIFLVLTSERYLRRFFMESLPQIYWNWAYKRPWYFWSWVKLSNNGFMVN